MGITRREFIIGTAQVAGLALLIQEGALALPQEQVAFNAGVILQGNQFGKVRIPVYFGDINYKFEDDLHHFKIVKPLGQVDRFMAPDEHQEIRVVTDQWGTYKEVNAEVYGVTLYLPEEPKIPIYVKPFSSWSRQPGSTKRLFQRSDDELDVTIDFTFDTDYLFKLQNGLAEKLTDNDEQNWGQIVKGLTRKHAA